MAFQGEGEGERQNLEKLDVGAIAGLVSTEAWDPGGDPLEGRSVEEGLSRISVACFSSCCSLVPPGGFC